MPYYSGDYYVGDPGRKFKARGGKVGKSKRSKGKGRLRRGAGAAVDVLGGLLEEAGGAGRRAARGARGGRRRRMHVTNVRALRRAMRRVKGFAHLAQKTIGFTKRVHMKRTRRRT